MIEQAETRRLYRSRTDRRLAGVCGGLGHYFNIDPVLVRLGFVALFLASGGIWLLAYIVLAIVIPEVPEGEAEPRITESVGTHRGGEILAYILIGIGAIILAGNLGIFHWIQWSLFWPFVLIAVGAALLATRVRR